MSLTTTLRPDNAARREADLAVAAAVARAAAVQVAVPADEDAAAANRGPVGAIRGVAVAGLGPKAGSANPESAVENATRDATS